MRFSWAIVLAGALAVPSVALAAPKVDDATALMVQQRYSEAEPILRKVVARNPNDAEAQYNLGAVLREMGHYDDAAVHYHIALDLFGPSDESNQSKCLYGIALARDAQGDPAVAVGAWDNYIRFAQRFTSEQPSVGIARNHLDGQMRAANMRGPYPFGPPTATRPQNQQ